MSKQQKVWLVIEKNLSLSCASGEDIIYIVSAHNSLKSAQKAATKLEDAYDENEKFKYLAEYIIKEMKVKGE